MAIYFKLLDKSTGEAVSLPHVDERICEEVYHCKAHHKFWGGHDPEPGGHTFNWYDTIGFQLASGRTLEDGEGSVREHYAENEMWDAERPVINKVIDFMQANYRVQFGYTR